MPPRRIAECSGAGASSGHSQRAPPRGAEVVIPVKPGILAVRRPYVAALASGIVVAGAALFPQACGREPRLPGVHPVHQEAVTSQEEGLGDDPTHLIRILEDQESANQLKTAAAIRLGTLGDPRAVPVLIATLEEGQVKVSMQLADRILAWLARSLSSPRPW